MATSRSSSLINDKLDEVKLSAHSRNDSAISQSPFENKNEQDINLIESGELSTNASTPFEPPYTVFGPKIKIFIVVMVAFSALISPLAATLYFPALPLLSEQLGVSNSLINLTVTTFMICQAIAPAIFAGMSDNSGRRLSFIICFSIFFVANIGLALQTNYAALLILRMVQSTGSSGAIALSMAVVSDVVTSAQRGVYNGLATAGILAGGSLGPVLGGILAQYLGWRAIFWFCVIFGGIFLILFTLVFPETCRNVVGNGSVPPKGVYRSLVGFYVQKQLKATNYPIPTTVDDSTASKRKSKFPNPLDTLRILGEKESCLLLVYNSLSFAGQMITYSALPSILSTAYGYDTLKTGLCFLPLGVGSLTASLSMGFVADWNFRRTAKKVGFKISNSKQQDLSGFPLEKARIQVIWPNHFCGVIFMIAFGWAVNYTAHIAIIEVLLFFVALSITGAFSISNIFLIDLHRDKPATATAAVNFTRCLISAGGAAAIVPMMNAWGRGWAFSFLGFITFALTGALYALQTIGPKWRAEREAKLIQSEAKLSEKVKSKTEEKVITEKEVS